MKFSHQLCCGFTIHWFCLFTSMQLASVCAHFVNYITILIVDSWILSVFLLYLSVCCELWGARWLLLNPLMNSNFIVCLINKVRLAMLLKVATKVLAWTKRNQERKKRFGSRSMWDLKSKLKKSQKILSLNVKKRRKTLWVE